MQRRIFPPLILTVLSMAVLIGFVSPGPAAGQYSTPDWTLRTAAGGSVSFHDQLDRGPVLVSFWALWCNPCLKELPHLDQLAGDFADQMTVLSVNIDDSQSVARVQPFIQSKGFSNVVVPLDTSGDLQRLMQVGGIVPFLVLYDADGRELYRHTGYKEGDEAELRREIEQMLATAAAAPPAAARVFAPSLADWTLPTADGNRVKFYDVLHQGPTLVSFWALWCNPCLKELPHLDQLGGDYTDQLTVLAVNIDDSQSVARVQPFIESKGFTNVIVPLDTAGELQRLMQVGGVVPFLVLFDSSGREVYRHTGYKEGDEVQLHDEVAALLARERTATVSQPVGLLGGTPLGDVVKATNQFEYSYSSETQEEIFENWLDVSYQLGKFRTGLLLNSQAPSEEGYRGTSIRQLFFEFYTGDFFIRAGHFYGMFGRGLLYNSYENRFIRVDTRLVGVRGSVNYGPISGTVFSGSTQNKYLDERNIPHADLDIRGGDFEYAAPFGTHFGVSGLTYLPQLFAADLDPDEIYREWVYTVRAYQTLPHFAYYLEYGEKTGYDFDPFTTNTNRGIIRYGNFNFFAGPITLALEGGDYNKFTVVRRVDGTTPLNKPPALTREHIYTLLNRAPHNLNADDDQGGQAELNVNVGRGNSLVVNASHIETQHHVPVYREFYVHWEQERFGPWRFRLAYAYQESEGLRQTPIAEVTYRFNSTQSLTLQAEHQHVRLGGTGGYDFGEYDQDWFKLEYEIAPNWAFAAILEVDNMYQEQRDFLGLDKKGPFPSAVVAYNIRGGGNLAVWYGKRQAGNVCSGGICKYEPEFEGIEFFGLFRF